MDADRAQRILKAITVVSFAIALVALLGELRGWWNDLGEIAITVATIVGALGGVATVLVGSTSDEVRSVGREIRSVGEAVDRNGGKLDAIGDALVEDTENGRVSRLDVVQAELDHQTGALDRQVSLLREIRDQL